MPPPAALSAARRFGLDPATLSPLNGRTGQTWAVGPHVLRLSTPARLDVEVAAMSAAAPAVPVPDILDRVDLGDDSGAILITRLPGRPAGDLSGIDDPGRCRERGRACGRIHSALASVTAPPAVPVVPDQLGRQLLHLDLHFLNVLVGDDDRVTGVLDWANTAAGDPALDRARTWTILRHDPAVRSGLAEPGNAGLAALVDGWVEEAGLDALPETEPVAVAWACRFMVRDLAGRYRPDELAHVARLLAGLVRRAP